ncbi:MAG: hypothetical protein ACOYNZ_19470 [Rhodoferax sp.]
MNQSLRENIIQAVVALLSPIALAQGATLIRSPPTGITREQSPALLIFPESETVSPRINDRVERQLVLRMVAVARETVGSAPEAIADALLVAAHAELFASANLGGLCLGLRELECEWDVEDADATAAAIPARYQITYTTLARDISMIG